MNETDLGSHALWSLIPISIFAGLVMAFVFRRYSDRHAIHTTINRILARLMEIRLFIDEPALVMRANRALLRENWHLVRLLIRPSMVLAVPFIILLAQMDAFYGRAPLRIGDPAIVTVQLKNGDEAVICDVRLRAPAAIAVETPGVHVVSQHQISWRIRAVAPLSGDLQVIGPKQVARKSITADSGVHYLSERRVSSLPAFLLHPVERPLFDSAFAWIEVLYPSATILHWHWLVWFFLVSSVTGIAAYGFSGMINRIFA